MSVLDEGGEVLGRRRIGDSLQGLRSLHELIADHVEEPSDVVIGIEKDRGLIVTGLVAAGYLIYAINPLASSRYRERHHTSGSKSDPGDAKMLADLVRTDRRNHRTVAGDSQLSEALKVLARAHQNTIWSRQRQVNALRSSLKDYYPGALETFGTDLANRDALAVLAAAPTPQLGHKLTKTKIVTVLKRGGRQRALEAKASDIYEALQRDQMRQGQILENAYGYTTASHVRVITQLNTEVRDLEAALSEHFEEHPSALIITSLPGIGTVLGARVLGARR